MTVIMTLLAICAMVLVDQVVKYWAVTVLASVGTIPLVPGVLQLTYVENRGAAFSILQNQIWLFVVLTIIVLVMIAYALRSHFIQTTFGRLSLIVIASGAVGNVIDRIFRHFVVDMIEVTFFSFPVFNIADIYVTVGVALFMLYILFQHKDRDETAQEDENK